MDLPKLLCGFVEFKDYCDKKKLYSSNNSAKKRALQNAISQIKDQDRFVESAFKAANKALEAAGFPAKLEDAGGNFLGNLRRSNGHRHKCAALHFRILQVHSGIGKELNTKVFGNAEIPGIFAKTEAETTGQTGDTAAAPFQPISMPDAYVPRKAKLREVKAALLDQKSGRTVALTTMLHGFGGLGKSTLARAIRNDPDIRKAYSDIVWIQCEQDRSLRAETLVTKYIRRIDPSADAGLCKDAASAREQLAKALAGKQVLLIVDDVWYESQADLFKELPGPSRVLLTTRMKGLAPPGAALILVDEMEQQEALDVLKWNLELHTYLSEGDVRQISDIAVHLDHWAQLLDLANAWLRLGCGDGTPLAQAAAAYLTLLDKRGIGVADNEDMSGEPHEKRARNMRICIEASLKMVVELLGKDALTRCLELGILPKGTEIPVDVICDLWRESAGLIEEESGELLKKLANMSLLQVVSADRELVGLHDNLIDELSRRLGAERSAEAHRAMLAGLGRHCAGEWANLPQDHRYGWTHLLRHMEAADMGAAVNACRTDYNWLKAKLLAVGAAELHRSFLPAPSDPEAAKTGRAIALSLAVISTHPKALAHQVYGRLGHETLGRVAQLAAVASEDSAFAPAFIRPHLLPLGAELVRFTNYSGIVTSATFSPDGAQILTASIDQTARLWDAATGDEIRPFKGHDGSVASAIFSPDGARVLTASSDKTARLWDAATGDEIRPFKGHDGSVTSATFSPDGTQVLTASGDKSARLWDATTGDEIRPFRGHEDLVTSAVFSPDGAQILTASVDYTARLWDVVSGKEVRRFKDHGCAVNSSAFSPDGTQVLTACYKGKAHLWDAATGNEIRRFRNFSSSSTSAIFSPDGAQLLTASYDRVARILDIATGDVVQSFRGHDDIVRCAVFSKDGGQVLTASNDGTARLWDASAGGGTRPIDFPRFRVNSVAFSQGCSQILTASHDKTARVWDIATGNEIQPFMEHRFWVTSATFSQDGMQILTTSIDSSARLWDVATGKEIRRFRGHDQAVNTAAFSPDHRQILTASNDGTARLWDASTGDVVRPFRGHDDWVVDAAFSPNGAQVLTASADKTARLWDAGSGDEIQCFRGHNRVVNTATFSLDPMKILTASSDGTARCWDASTGDEIRVFRGHRDAVTSATFSPTAGQVLTISRDRTARMWDAKTGTCFNITHFDSMLFAAAFGANQIAYGDADGGVHIARWNEN